MREKRTESEIAAAIVGWLRGQEWDVYQEVQPRRGASGRCDIVATMGPIIWAIETKTTLSLALIGQALDWMHHANYVSVGIPVLRRTVGERILLDYGIGVIRIRKNGDVYEIASPKLRRGIDAVLRDSLCEEQKTYAAAGNNRGDFYSPFKRTRDQLIHLAARYPGISLRVAIQEVSHHYSSGSSAAASIRHWINAGIIKDLKIERGKLYPVEGK